MTSVYINFDGQKLECPEGSSVLDVVLKNKINVPFSCRMGNCHSCLLRQTKGSVPAGVQTGLSHTLKQQGYFLSCMYYPPEDIDITFAAQELLYSPAKIFKKELLASNILKIFIEVDSPDSLGSIDSKPSYYAGQFINIKRDDGLVRSYSLASLPNRDPFYEIHVKRMSGGKMSNWLFDEAEVGEALDVHGPTGDSFYIQGDTTQPILLIGTGSGLAPLLAIARQALLSKHQGEIYLYHGSHNVEGLYLHKTLLELDAQHETFHYIACVSAKDFLQDSNVNEINSSRANELAFKNHPDLKHWRVYLCGAPPMVKSAQTSAYLAGADMGDIHADPFEVQELRKVKRTN